jgi:DNA-binding transcriptional LysR family regulator
MPDKIEDLTSHRCLSYGQIAAVQRWTLTKGPETVQAPITSVLCSNNGDVLRAAALRGQGIAILPTFLVGPDIAAGRLDVVLPRHQALPLALHALYAPNRFLAAKTRKFIDFLVECFGETPVWDAIAQDP